MHPLVAAVLGLLSAATWLRLRGSSRETKPWPKFPVPTYQLETESPLNLQRIHTQGPHFQGWLMRVVDHEKQLSCMLIVGCFSSLALSEFSQHYIFCAIDHNGVTVTQNQFPDKSEVRVHSSLPKRGLNVSFQSPVGEFSFDDSKCRARFAFSPTCGVSLETTNRIPWRKLPSSFAGPEGWLGFTGLLPCHYFIHSVGSEARYTLHSPKTGRVSGNGFCHIEGNYGSYFPRGWVWSHAIAPENSASFSLVAGKFSIGPVSPMSVIFFLRRRNGEVAVFRSVDADSAKYYFDGVQRVIRIQFSSLFKNMRATIKIRSNGATRFHTAYIPTATGFSNQPGCQETYDAIADVVLHTNSGVEEVYAFPLTALEFGGSFIDTVHSNGEVND